jgi:hypothetical protein
MATDTNEDKVNTFTFVNKGRKPQYNDFWTQRKTTPVKCRLDTKEDNCSTMTSKMTLAPDEEIISPV